MSRYKSYVPGNREIAERLYCLIRGLIFGMAGGTCLLALAIAVGLHVPILTHAASLWWFCNTEPTTSPKNRQLSNPPSVSPQDRLKGRFAGVGLCYPPSDAALIVRHPEGVIELWAQGPEHYAGGLELDTAGHVLVRSYSLLGIRSASGGEGQDAAPLKGYHTAWLAADKGILYLCSDTAVTPHEAGGALAGVEPWKGPDEESETVLPSVMLSREDAEELSVLLGALTSAQVQVVVAERATGWRELLWILEGAKPEHKSTLDGLRELWDIAATSYANKDSVSETSSRLEGALYYLAKGDFEEANLKWFDYVARTYRDSNGWGYLEILRGGQRLYARTGISFQFVRFEEEQGETNITPVGKDITGDGQPNLVVWEWTGGAHAAFIARVFEIGKRFGIVPAINGIDSCPCFLDLRGDGRLEVTVGDCIFTYWGTSFAQSPIPEVILRYENGVYRAASDLMHKPAPSSKEIDDTAATVRKAEDWRDGMPPPKLWDYMLRLIYSGHSDLAWQFCAKAWPSDCPGRRLFLKQFKTRLAESSYWREMQQGK